MEEKSIELSKAGLRFINRLDNFDEDIEFVNLLYSSEASILKSKNNETLFDGLDKRSILSRRKVNARSRKLVIAHLRSTVYVAFIKEIYEEFSEYLRTLLEEASLSVKENAKRIIGNCSINYQGIELLNYQNIKDIHKRIANDVFRQLENERSTIKLLKIICDRLQIRVDQQIIDGAMPYLELRHVLVHADGKADDDFLKKYKDIFIYKTKRVNIDLKVVENAKKNIKELVVAIDKEAVYNGIVKGNTCI